MTPKEAKKFVEEARARADKAARERHGNIRAKPVVKVDDKKDEK